MRFPCGAGYEAPFEADIDRQQHNSLNWSRYENNVADFLCLLIGRAKAWRVQGVGDSLGAQNSFPVSSRRMAIFFLVALAQ